MKRPLVPLAVSLLVASSWPGGCSAPGSDLNAATVSESAATPAPCPLHCENGGVCRHGSADASSLHPVHSMYTPLDAPFLDASHSSHHSRAHCVCPAGYVGPTCAVALETCSGRKGSDRHHHCFHGAPCRLGISDTGTEFYYCECSEAGRARDGSGGRNRRNFYAGHMCQHASTTVCGLENGTKDGRNAEEEGGDNGSHNSDRRRTTGSFCTNWGTCREGGNGEEHPGCDCLDNWQGPHCEYRKGTDQMARYSPQHQSSLPSSGNSGAADNPTDTGVDSMQDETSAESRKRWSGLVFVIVAVIFSAIGMSFPQFVKWWRKRKENRGGGEGGSPAAEVTATVGNMDPDGAASMSSVSMSEAETITVSGDASSVTMVPPPPLPPPTPSTDVLV